ncbi:MAG: methionine adenosyltransferase domain-containing protein [Candidatus Magasanikbacteria bacterium]|nr:methionine adenosyltransferase domain-containing protein [Candidatus Magasanikbacteria bacterium]
MKKTAEFVSPKHPDKICDVIADSILDAYYAVDPNARVAIEVMGGHNLITINGEVTAKGVAPDIQAVVKGIVGAEFVVLTNIARQSPQIAQGVDTGGAGDQGIMKGYACVETAEKLPLEYVLARRLCQAIFGIYPFDGKTQVTVENGVVTCVVASFQNTKSAELLPIVRAVIPGAGEYLINPAGEWTQGGFDADTGLSGRKLIVDNYGPEVAIGGGSFSGKDYTKVDRSGAYMARKIAVDLLAARPGAREVVTKLAYAIGKADPVMAVAVVDGVEEEISGYNLSPAGIRAALGLERVRYAETCTWGHFGRGFSWDAGGVL